MPMNVPVGNHWLPGSFQVKIISWLLTPLIFERGEPCRRFWVGASNPASQTVQCSRSDAVEGITGCDGEPLVFVPLNVLLWEVGPHWPQRASEACFPLVASVSISRTKVTCLSKNLESWAQCFAHTHGTEDILV